MKTFIFNGGWFRHAAAAMLVIIASSCVSNAAWGANSYSYAGENADSLTSLTYDRERYYDPTTGTFLTKDPLGVEAGSNGFTYCNDNAVNLTDPLGTDPVSDVANQIYNQEVASNPANGQFPANYLNYATIYASAWSSQHTQGLSIAGTSINNGALVLGAGSLTAGIMGDLGLLGANGTTASTAVGTGYRYVGDQEAANIDTNLTIPNTGADGVTLKPIYYSDTLYPTGEAAQSALSLPNTPTFVAEFNINDVTPEYNGIVEPVPAQGTTPALPGGGVEYIAPAGTAPIPITNLLSLDSGSSSVISDGLLPDALTLSNVAVGGVLINEAATLVGTSLSSIQGATYDPTTKQIIFLGSNNTPASTLTSINMDYFYTAIQAVYGSATPPYVTLDPPASAATQWPFSQTFTNNSSQGFVLLYNPLWAGQDTTVSVRFRMTNQSGTLYDFTYAFDCVELNGYNGLTIDAGGRYAMGLVYDASKSTGTPPPGLFLNTEPFQSGFPESMTLTSSAQTSYWPIELTNNTGGNLVVSTVSVIPARQHREYGGRIDGTKLGWVMYEADRVMKCLAVGKDNLTGASYSSTSGNVNVSGYYNLEELAQQLSDTGGFNRMWFEPNDMTLQRYVDPVSGQATIGFQSSTVQLLTEAYLQGVPADPAANAFVTFFTNNYSTFAAQSFPVEDPVNPSTIDSVPIFAMLQQAMQAVCLARFFHDNSIPLDTWWMSSYQPPVASSPLTIPTAYNEAATGSPWFLIYGGVRVHKPNAYVPSSNAQSLGTAVLSARPAPTSSSALDIPGQVWNVNGTNQGNLTVVSASLAQDTQDGNVNLAQTDLSLASPGELPLQFTRYYQSSWTATTNLGPGWRDVRYGLQFSAPSWNDQYHLLTDSGGHSLATATNGDTYLHSGAVRMVDLSNGTYLDFTSSLNLSYGLNAQGNPSDTITGLNGNDLPTFTSGTNQNGSTLAQNTDGTFDYTATLPDGSKVLFDPSGNLLKTTDRHGHTQTYGYNSSGQLTTITDDASQSLTLTYNATSGLLNGVTASDNEGVTFKYDTSGRLMGVVNTLSTVATYQFAYNSQNQLTTVTNMDGTTPINSSADPKGRSSSRVDAKGNTTNYTYVKNGNGTRSTTAMLVNSGLSAAQKNTDTMGRTTSVTDVLGHTFGYTYNGNSLLPNSVQLPTPNRPAIQIARNSYNQPTSITDPAVTGASPTQLSYNTTTNNLLNQVVDGAGRATKFYYTASNNPYQVTRQHNGAAIGVTFGYDGNDKLTTVSDPLSHQWTINNDSLGRVTGVVDPTGVGVSCTYDQYGNVATVTDPRLSSQIKYGYDGLHRVTSITSPTGSISYNYDPVTQWVDSTTQKDSGGNTIETVSYTHNNANGEVTGSTATLSQPGVTGSTNVTTTFGYDSYGNLTSTTPSNSQPINLSYNAAGQLLGTSETDAGPAVGPTIIASNAASGVWTTQKSQTMSWGAPQSSLPITGYSYAEDGSAGSTVNVSGTSLAWSNVSDGEHIFAMRAVDQAGNWSPQSVFNLWVDSTPPSVADVNVTPNPIPQGSVTVTITANISDAASGLSGTPQIRWYVGSSSPQNWGSYAPMAGSGSQWSSSFVEPGTGQTLYYQIQSQDVAGNSGVYTGSMNISGPSGNDGPLMPPLALALLALLFFAVGNWLVNRKVKPEALHK